MSLPGTLDKAWNRFDRNLDWKDRVIKIELNTLKNKDRVFQAWVWSDKYDKPVFVTYCYYSPTRDLHNGNSHKAFEDSPVYIRAKFWKYLTEAARKEGVSTSMITKKFQRKFYQNSINRRKETK